MARRLKPLPVRRAWLTLLLILLGASLVASPSLVGSQEATPAASPAASPGASPVAGTAIRSLTREEFNQQLEATYAFEPPARRGGTVIDAKVGEFRTLNPVVANDEGSYAVTNLVFEWLFGRSPIDGQPVPNKLADWWEIAPDGVTYTFHLNQNATWHDGIDVTAEDVAFSFDAVADEQTGSSYTGQLLATVGSYRVVDADTFELTSNGVLADFLIDLYVPIVPRHIWEAIPHADWASDPGSTGQDPARVVGTGPLKFQEWVQGESVTLVRNDDYYDLVPNLETYVMRAFPDTESTINALQNGEVDIAELSPAAVADVEQSPELAVVSYPTPNFRFYAYNLDPAKTTLFQQREVRQALFLALDREAIVRDIDLGYGVVAQGIHAPFNFAYAPDRLTTRYGYDPDRARQLLAAAGWSDGNGDGIVEKDGQELRFELLYPSGDANLDQYAVYMQDAWEAIGVAMTPTPLEFNALVDAVSVTFDYEVAMLAFGEAITGSHAIMFNCDQYEVGFNMTRYCNPHVDDLNNRARQELDPAKRRELLIQAENLIHDDLAVAIVRYNVATIGYSDPLHNFFPNPFESAAAASGGVSISRLWLEG